MSVVSLKHKYIVKSAVFNTDGQAVYHPAGRHNAARDGAPQFKPPPTRTKRFYTLQAARTFCDGLARTYGADSVAFTILPVDPKTSPPRPVQQPLFENLPIQVRDDSVPTPRKRSSP